MAVVLTCSDPVTTNPGITPVVAEVTNLDPSLVLEVRLWQGGPNDAPSFPSVGSMTRDPNDGAKWNGQVTTMTAGQRKMRAYCTYKTIIESADKTITVNNP